MELPVPANVLVMTFVIILVCSNPGQLLDFFAFFLTGFFGTVFLSQFDLCIGPKKPAAAATSRLNGSILFHPTIMTGIFWE